MLRDQVGLCPVPYANSDVKWPYLDLGNVAFFEATADRQVQMLAEFIRKTSEVVIETD